MSARRTILADALENLAWYLIAGGVLIAAWATWAALSPPTINAPAAPAPMAVGMAGECPIFHAWGRDGSETYTLTCAPGARLGPLQLKGQAR